MLNLVIFAFYPGLNCGDIPRKLLCWIPGTFFSGPEPGGATYTSVEASATCMHYSVSLLLTVVNYQLASAILCGIVVAEPSILNIALSPLIST